MKTFWLKGTTSKGVASDKVYAMQREKDGQVTCIWGKRGTKLTVRQYASNKFEKKMKDLSKKDYKDITGVTAFTEHEIRSQCEGAYFKYMDVHDLSTPFDAEPETLPEALEKVESVDTFAKCINASGMEDRLAQNVDFQVVSITGNLIQIIDLLGEELEVMKERFEL